ncbi:MAG: hypothetical protein H0Z24_06955 [Thermosipho sp. (in: Bacteria)]|nr:hypothetical protein [Thermosipho sp. (in: thermotogales)]
MQIDFDKYDLSIEEEYDYEEKELEDMYNKRSILASQGYATWLMTDDDINELF